ncbi:putative methyltransferase-like 6 [Homarus americanus]|uniref:Putative methyltransferase-like 6 n=1 Tax=Homarus americanus TaxID=6706 RepID=A0A8J5KAA1_HOMAM|nr:putative methyltransferase-like 6 [Homarus americanus]
MMYLYTKYEFVQFEEVKKDHFASFPPSSPTTRSSAKEGDQDLKSASELVSTLLTIPRARTCGRTETCISSLIGRRIGSSSQHLFWRDADDFQRRVDNSVDVVVITLVLCSVPNRPNLKGTSCPGARGIYFMEHIAEFDPEKHGLRKMMQDVLTYLYVWLSSTTAAASTATCYPTLRKLVSLR